MRFPTVLNKPYERPFIAVLLTTSKHSAAVAHVSVDEFIQRILEFHLYCSIDVSKICVSACVVNSLRGQ